MIISQLLNHLTKIMLVIIAFKLSLLQFDIFNFTQDLRYVFIGIYQMFINDISFLTYYSIFILPIFVLLNKKNIDYKYINFILFITISILFLFNYLSVYYLNKSIQIYDIYNISINNLNYLFSSIDFKFLLLLIIPLIIFKINSKNFEKYFLTIFTSIVFISLIIHLIIIKNSLHLYKQTYPTENFISNIFSSYFYTNKYLKNINEYKVIQINNENELDLPKLDLNNKNIFVFNLESFGYDYFNKENSPFLYSLTNNSIFFNNMFSNYPYTKDSLVNVYTGKDLELYSIKNSNKLFNSNTNENILQEFKNLGYNLNFTTSGIASLHGSFFDNNFFEKNFNFKKNIGQDLIPYNQDIYKEDEYLDKYLNQVKNKEFNGYLTSMTHWPYYSFQEKEIKEIKVENYIKSIKKQDEYFKILFEKYPILKESIIIFIGDHGQGFGEHKFYYHNELYNEVLHIPAFIYFKEINKKEINNYYSQSNILPTVLSLIKGISIENSIFDKKTNKYIISTNLNKISFIDKETKEKYLFIKNKCIKFDLLKDFKEKNTLECNETKINEMFNHIRLKD